MLFIIHAYESVFQGLHGIEDWACVNCEDFEEAEMIGLQMSTDVIMNYNVTEDAIQSEVEYELELDDELDEDELYEEVFKEHLEYEVYELKEEYQYLDEVKEGELIDTLNHKLTCEGYFYNIIEEYCEK